MTARVHFVFGIAYPANILIGFSHPKARYFLVATRKYPKKRSPGSAAAHPAATLAPALVSGGPGKGLPCPWPGRTRSLSCPFGPAPRLHSGLGLTKGAKNNVNFTLLKATPNPAALAPVQTGVGVALVLFWNPLTQAEGGGRAKSKHEVAGQGPPRSPQAQGCALGEPSEPSAERGDPAPVFRCGAQSPGCPLFRFLSLGTQRKEPVVRGWNPVNK
jgi:hypothetical protein